MRILIADDETLIRHFLTDLLEREGHEIIASVDGREALKALETFTPDVIISDVKMPNLDGFGLLQEIRKQGNSTPVIMLTGYADMRSAIDALKFGAHDFMLKPVERETLLSRLAQVQREIDLKAEAEKERTRTNQMTRMATVGQLAAGVAHEINNPTTFVRGNAQLLQGYSAKLLEKIEAKDPEVLRDFVLDLQEQMTDLLEGIIVGTERIRSITFGLSSFAGSQKYEPKADTDFNACIEDSLSLLKEMSAEVAIFLDLSKDLPSITICRRSIIQALLCLFVNAIQASLENPNPQIHIRTSLAENGGVDLSIQDNGLGIPAENRERIFDPFFTTREVNDGTGLGLTVAYGIICTDHAGTLRLIDDDQDGTTFRLTLPQE